MIVKNNETGLIASTAEEWKQYLKILISDSQLRMHMGKKGRDHIINEFSLIRHSNTFLNLFNH